MGAYDHIDRTLRVAKRSAFQELQVAEFSPLIELDSSNGLSDLRDVQTTANNGTITNTNGQHKLSTSATANGSATLDTAERGRYQPGITGLPGIAVRRPSAPTGNQFWEAGYFDDNDGFRFGEDSNGLYVRLRVGGTDKAKVYQSGMNGDPLDGSGRTGLTLDLTKPHILRMPFVWYFGGPIEMEVLVLDEDNDPHIVTMHRFGHTAGEPIVEEPKLPVRALVDNGGDTKSLDLFVGGRQFAVLGRYAPNRRVNSETVFAASLSGTTVVPLISFRKKSAHQSKSAKIAGIDMLSADDLQILLLLDASLTGASFGALSNVGATETALEVDTSATAVSSGQSVFETLLSGGNGNQTNLAGIARLGLDLPGTKSVTLAARKVSGADGAATATLRMEEEW